MKKSRYEKKLFILLILISIILLVTGYYLFPVSVFPFFIGTILFIESIKILFKLLKNRK